MVLTFGSLVWTWDSHFGPHWMLAHKCDIFAWNKFFIFVGPLVPTHSSIFLQFWQLFCFQEYSWEKTVICIMVNNYGGTSCLLHFTIACKSLHCDLSLVGDGTLGRGDQQWREEYCVLWRPCPGDNNQLTVHIHMTLYYFCRTVCWKQLWILCTSLLM